jgi:hypothetical protein
MLKGKISIDLPSTETERKMTVLERIRSICGAKIHLASGNEELTVSALTLASGLVEGFRAAGINNAIAFLVDKKVIFNDAHEREDDLHLILEAAQRTEILNHPFREMHLVLTKTENGIHSIFDVKIRNGVLLGVSEMIIEVSGRLLELRLKDGETAEDYAARIQDFMKEESKIESKRLLFQELMDRVSTSLQRALVGSKARTDDANVFVVQPTQQQISDMERLKFGKDVEDTHFRSVPTHQRSGAYADPFYYYYYDPYYSLTNFFLLNAMLGHHYWHTPNVHVVGGDGNLLYTGDEASGHAQSSWGSDAVSFSDNGGIDVDQSALPAASADSGAGTSWDSGHAASDWGSSDASTGSDSMFSGFGSSSDSSCASSSDSSSCNSSSCGSSCSSCGGGCGGGCS